MSDLIVDERTGPSLREVLGGLLARAGEADFAVARIRLAGIDLSAVELGRVRRCRVLVGRLDADALSSSPDGDDLALRRRSVEAMLGFLESGRLEVRAAGLESWVPDFSVLREIEGAPGPVALVGAHYFARPYPVDGPALTCIFHDSEIAARIGGRFEEIWARGYDVGGVVRQSLERIAAGLGAGVSTGSGTPPGPVPGAVPGAGSDAGPGVWW